MVLAKAGIVNKAAMVRWGRWVAPLAATGLMLLIRWPLNQVLGDRASLLPFMIGIVCCAWWGGLWPGMIATGLSLAAYAVFLPHRSGGGALDHVPVVVFAVEGILISWLSGLRRAADRRAEELTQAEHQSRQILRERDTQLRSVVDSLAEGLVVSDLTGRLVHWNPAALEIHGFGCADELRRPLDELGETFELSTLEGTILPVDQWPLSRILRGEVLKDCELRMRRRNGGWQRIVSYGGTLVRDSRHRPILAVVTIVDITDRKEAERSMHRAIEEAEQANRSKDYFLAILSHELRTPLMPALLHVSALETDLRLPEDVRSDLRVARQNIELESRLIDDLLDLTRIARGKMQLRDEVVDVHEVIAAVLDICAAGISSGKLTTEVDLQADAHQVRGDSARLQQVFWNLLKNAIKFTPAGGKITIRSSNDARGSGLLRVEIKDTGIGMEPSLLPRLFNPFEQGNRNEIGQFAGLGLGLAIARSVLTILGGEIVARSEGKNRGSQFVVELPTVEMAAENTRAGPTKGARPLASEAPFVSMAPALVPTAAATGPAMKAAPISGTPAASQSEPIRRLLLVEDHTDTARTLGILLRKSGFEVEIADSVAAALAAAERVKFDLLVSDIGLPDGSGFELMRTLRDRYGLKGIAVSGYGMAQDLRASQESGFVEHLTKPLNFQMLRETIRRIAA